MTGTATSPPTPLFMVMEASDAEALMGEMAQASQTFKEASGLTADKVWLHPDWQEEIEGEVGLGDFVFLTGLTPVYDKGKRSHNHIQVGIATRPANKNGRPNVPAPAGMKKKAKAKPKREKVVVKQEETDSTPRQPDADNLWQAFVVGTPGVDRIIDAAKAAAATYVEKLSMEPTHLALHISFEGKADEIEKATGLTPCFDRPIQAYPTWGMVGLRELEGATVAVKSTNIKEVSFFPNEDDTGTVFVVFKRRPKAGVEQKDSVYQYNNVPNALYQKMLEATSKGKFLNTHLKTSPGVVAIKLA